MVRFDCLVFVGVDMERTSEPEFRLVADLTEQSAAKQAEQTADYFRNCVEHLRTPGGSSIVSVAYDDNGDRLASRIRTAHGNEYHFKVDGESYELRQGAIRDPGLFKVKYENGETQRIKIDRNTDEYTKAVGVINKVDFDHLPLC